MDPTIEQPSRARKRGRSDEPSYRDIIASRTAEEKEREKTRIRVNEFVSVSELADLMKIPANQIVAFAFKQQPKPNFVRATK